ncbi:Rrf2 family transcriptional regulator [Sphingomonas sp. CFBP 8760]|uniref:Rrf2 family transcriptional regulator n=1 Tax=Sphingomonas sp. CFBP 8760 TaxID=2775282 RepID=UPI0017805AD0|nr:Rrf2 family transcriptional regulator [Sphingomonas sp. CFBP 8760]MBD8548856.1 Rrf2 family transcriptional regulator [Sphingomonas sp. CFBP 8760]
MEVGSLDARLSRMLHLLIHMARAEGPLTSEAAAAMLNTNPVVVRRTMAGLREAGYVSSVKGHGGGWSLTRELESITMLDVHRALGENRIFALGPANPAPDCLVEQAVNGSLEDALRQAEAVLLQRLTAVTLADIAADFERRMAGLSSEEIAERRRSHLQRPA